MTNPLVSRTTAIDEPTTRTVSFSPAIDGVTTAIVGLRARPVA
ncbi:MAG TPA: hypothetical protein VKU41_11750 [Polyangiaceae bacterium]|nr:hypothetical protein [Polyangiaceae bacterium]